MAVIKAMKVKPLTAKQKSEISENNRRQAEMIREETEKKRKQVEARKKK